jgi:hypothetical protein
MARTWQQNIRMYKSTYEYDMKNFLIYRLFSTKYYQGYKIGEDEMGRPTANMGEIAYAHKLQLRNLDERDHQGELSAVGY